MISKKAISILVAAIVVGLWETTPRIGRAETLVDLQKDDTHTHQRTTATINRADISPTDNSLMAQFYPSVSKQNVIMVIGQGQVSAPADAARVAFVFSSNNPSGDSEAENPSQTAKAMPITKELLRPITNALVTIGLPANTIELYVNSSSFPLSQGGAQVLVKLDKPTRERVQQIVTVAGTTASNNKLFPQSVDVQYTVKDCSPLEAKAYLAAMNDAQNRAKALATAMDVQVRGTPSVAEEPFGRLFSACNSEVNLSSFPFGGFTSSYDPSAPTEVRVWRNVFVTYTIK